MELVVSPPHRIVRRPGEVCSKSDNFMNWFGWPEFLSRVLTIDL
jgi:hypothetical protein